MVTLQEPSSAQQEPVGCTQRFGVQVPDIVQVPAAHSLCVATVQMPSGVQQEPVG